jgi:MOSC domain-containing protein YiiM
MRVVSVNVSLGRTVHWRGREIRTGIFKEPVGGRVMIRRTNVDGDRQSDLTVHGGELKAVYGYASEHYAWWSRELERELGPGMFGENLTVDGLDESAIAIGDRFAVGGAVLEAVQPRLPCFKLGIRFADPRMPKRFMQAGRPGIYFRVVQEGDVASGDAVTRTYEEPRRIPVAALVALVQPEARDRELVRRVLAVPALPPSWRELLERTHDVDPAPAPGPV